MALAGEAESGLGGEPVPRRQVYLLSTQKTKDDTSTSGSVCSPEPCMPLKSPPGHFIHSPGVSICPVLSLAIK